MAHLILPSRFNRQPQGAVEIDWINPLTRTLTHVYKGTEQLKNKPSDAVTYSGTAVNSVNATGRCIDTGSGGLAVIADPTSWTSPDTQKLTFSFVGEIRLVDSPYGGLFVKRKASNAAYGPMLGRDNTNDKFRVYNGNNYGIFHTLTISSLYGKQVVLTVTLFATSGTTTANIYVDGVLADTTTIAAWISTDSAGNLVIGGEQTASTTYGSEISCNLLTVWNGRILSSNEIQEFSTNPWQIFRKRPQILYFDAATGGATDLTTETGTFTLTGQAASLTGRCWIVRTHGHRRNADQEHGRGFHPHRRSRHVHPDGASRWPDGAAQGVC